jgi:hypothetical protein
MGGTIRRQRFLACAPVLAGAGLALPEVAHADADPLDALRPHPVITEVLFNVPNSDAGDADKDGTRDATGDEFVELTNPHAKPINLRGYALSSRLSAGDTTGKKGVRFTFPDLSLPPGAVVVVFNGYKSSLSGPVGSADRAPDKTHPDFAGAGVFSMRTTAKNRAWNNSGDFVLLSAPDGTPVDAVWWGEPDPMPPEATLRTAEAPANPGGSVQRTGAGTDPVAHTTIDSRACSPGEIPAPTDAKP